MVKLSKRAQENRSTAAMETAHNNIMLDLETMGNHSNAAIISIGAVKFGPGGVSSNKFHKMISLRSSVACGLKMDPDTVMWWMGQSNEARAQFKDNVTVADLSSALLSFSTWAMGAKSVWGDGSDFDNVILSNAYDACGIILPWKYYNNRCYRTMKNLYRDIRMDARVGIKHSAVDDAENQALHLIKILKTVGIW